MKLLGEKIFARNADGSLQSRIGTMFLRTPGLVTKKGIHALQRVMWIDFLNAERAAAGRPALSPIEEDAEMSESVDLIFTDDTVLIRPNPDRMDLAFRADEELQRFVSKRCIRYLNTSSSKVRGFLRSRGENWRMARQPISQEDMADLITHSKVAIAEGRFYYYNRMSGTRFLTASGYAEAEKLDAEAFRRQVAEIVAGLSKRNRVGSPEVDLFPPSTPIEVKRAFKELDVESLDDTALREKVSAIVREWRVSLPAELRDESVENYDWRKEMCHVLLRQPNESTADEQELIAGISPEFYRQIEWLPGARIVDGEVVFDPIYDEAARLKTPELLSLCDNRVKSFLFNTTRLFGRISYINIGRIVNSLARKPIAGDRRGHVYIMQYLEEGASDPKVVIIRLQKWGVAERLDEGKDLLRAIIETDEYSDFILDRRLMCRQLGMNLPRKLGYGHFTEKYCGQNAYNGSALRTGYFVRDYVHGIASDKVPPAKYRNPVWAQKFAFLMGEAAAIDMIVGRRSSVTNELLFDRNYEIVQLGGDGFPSEIVVTDHAGSFVDYERPLAELVGGYADFVKRRQSFVSEVSHFAKAYVDGFERKLTAVRKAYAERTRAFDELFSDRPYDSNGSGAYRWACALLRLKKCDPVALVSLLRENIGC